VATLLRRFVGIVTSLLIGIGAISALAAPAHAEDGYRYWNYFHLENGSWAFSEVGPADYQPEDGDVEGFRFGTSTPSQGIEPRADLDEVGFDTVCEGTEAGADQKRVAVVIDYGTEDAGGTPPDPRAECAVVGQDASTQQILGEVAEVRVESAMTCALDGYPASGCGEPVADAEIPTDEQPVSFEMPAGDTADDASTTDAADQSEGSVPTWGLVGIAALVVLIGLGAVLLARRRSA
jgi:hypothetical protein